MRILHVLHHSLPHHDGYSIRSKYILEFQRRAGFEVEAVTSAHHEFEVGRVGSERSVLVEDVDGVRVHRTPLSDSRSLRFQLSKPFLRERALMTLLHQSVLRVLDERCFDIVHVHSPVICGLPALRAARSRGLPFVYEVRALWEDGFVETGRFSAQSFRYRISRRLETSVFRKAAAVAAISEHLLDEIARRGIPGEKLFHVPNGVDVAAFQPLDRDQALAGRLALPAGAVLGFIGSFYAFEGLDSLLRAMPLVLERVPHARLLLVGGGDEEGRLKRTAAELGLEGRVLFTGRVPHGEVRKYYSLIDVLVYPRVSNRTTELVTPLKPLEAMALGRAVLGSDVGGIRELFGGGAAGCLFRPEDTHDLAAKAVRLLEDAALRQQFCSAARERVEAYRWESVVERYAKVYGCALPAVKQLAATTA
jgi:PEP-CTERM/exosortase A-associated glycosyltransferase